MISTERSSTDAIINMLMAASAKHRTSTKMNYYGEHPAFFQTYKKAQEQCTPDS